MPPTVPSLSALYTRPMPPASVGGQDLEGDLFGWPVTRIFRQSSRAGE
jgi:hypothetical protein